MNFLADISPFRRKSTPKLRPPPAPEPPRPPPPPGCPLRFEITPKALGAGSYGSVMLGTDRERENCSVAVKCVPDGKMRLEALVREVAIMQRLSAAPHPSVVNFHAWLQPGSKEVRAVGALDIELAECHCLIMDIVHGGEVFDHVINHGALREADAAPLMARICTSVQHAHSLGIVHRDLKLENVLFTQDDIDTPVGERAIKLIDWGLAHQLAMRPDGTVEREVLHSRCGSRSYMAPEVAVCSGRDGPGYDGFSADVWSLGICLFAMLVGFFPFEQADPQRDWRAARVLAAQRAGKSTIETIFAFYPRKQLEVSEQAHRLLDRMLRFDAKSRPSLDAILASPLLAAHAPKPAVSSSELPATWSVAPQPAEEPPVLTLLSISDIDAALSAPADGRPAGEADAPPPTANLVRVTSEASSSGSSVSTTKTRGHPVNRLAALRQEHAPVSVSVAGGARLESISSPGGAKGDAKGDWGEGGERVGASSPMKQQKGARGSWMARRAASPTPAY